MKKLDTALGRVPMYRLVTIVLAVLVVAAIVASIGGAISFTPLDLIASLATLLVVCYLSNRLFGLIFRTRPQSESAVITALLLFFVMWPSSDLDQLWTVALTGLIAMASKYLLVWRGRHILNPAAAGAFVITLTGLNASVWWVATGPLLPLVVLGGLLVLYRTREILTALVFVVVSAAIVVARLASAGTPLVDAVSTTFVSYPIVFLAAFMLSEPLTLPPRLWQRLGVAALAGVVFSVPVSIGAFATTPELSLVVANIVAFFFGQRAAIRLRYVDSRQLTPTAWEFVFEPVTRPRFRSGQYIELGLPHRAADARGTRRIFSIVSSPAAHNSLSVAMTVDRERPSSFKAALSTLERGSEIRATRIAGDFVLSPGSDSPVVLVAGGIGITPFISQLADPENALRLNDAVLLYSVRGTDELAYAPAIAAAGIRVVVLSADRPAALPNGWVWAGSSRLSAELLREHVPDVGGRMAYVSGPPAMVDHSRSVLRGAGVKHVRTDAFAGY